MVSTKPECDAITHHPLSDCRDRGDLTLVSNCAAECRAPAANPERIGQPPTVHPPQGSSSYTEDNHGHCSASHREHTPTHRCPLHPGGGQRGTSPMCTRPVVQTQEPPSGTGQVPCGAPALGKHRTCPAPTPKKEVLTGGGESSTVCVGPSSLGDSVPGPTPILMLPSEGRRTAGGCLSLQEPIWEPLTHMLSRQTTRLPRA